MSYNIKNIQLVWRGITLEGFASSKVNLSQKNEGSVILHGCLGECVSIPNPAREWKITAKFHPMSTAYLILEQDSLYNFQDTLIIRDLNTGSSDIFTYCSISILTNKKDSDERTVEWTAAKRNGR